jgi:hypothetical protein
LTIYYPPTAGYPAFGKWRWKSLPCAFVRQGCDTNRWLISSFALRRFLLFLVSSILVGGDATMPICLVLAVVRFGNLSIFLMLYRYRLVGGD